MLTNLEKLSTHLRKVAALEVAKPVQVAPKVEIEKLAKLAPVQLDSTHVLNFVKFFTA